LRRFWRVRGGRFPVSLFGGFAMSSFFVDPLAGCPASYRVFGRVVEAGGFVPVGPLGSPVQLVPWDLAHDPAFVPAGAAVVDGLLRFPGSVAVRWLASGGRFGFAVARSSGFPGGARGEAAGLFLGQLARACSLEFRPVWLAGAPAAGGGGVSWCRSVPGWSEFPGAPFFCAIQSVPFGAASFSPSF